MKLFQKLNNLVEPFNALIGLGFVRSKDYKKDVFGHLFMFRFNFKKVRIVKKLFIRI